MTTTMDHFDQLLDHTLRTRAAAPPAGMEQRLLAHLANASLRSTPQSAELQPTRLFTTSDRVNTSRSTTSVWTALLAHAAVLAFVLSLAAYRTQALSSHRDARLELSILAPPPPIAPRAEKLGGGGGQHSSAPVSAGHLPEFAQQLLAPPAPPVDQPRLAIEPAVVVQPDLKMADNKLPDLGLPTSNLKSFSLGTGSDSGLGSGDGNGMDAGSGGNFGGGPMHLGGGVHPPSVLSSVEPEFSEEARKAKFSGDVQIYLWVDEHGNPSHVRVARGIGMGLDEKAIAAVRQYKFKPATLNGKPVKVDLYINVNFQIF